MIMVMAMQVLHDIATTLQNTIMVDETTDISNREQVVLCFAGLMTILRSMRTLFECIQLNLLMLIHLSP